MPNGGLAQSGEGRCTIERPTRLHEDRQSGNDIVGCEQDGELADTDTARRGAGRAGEAGAWRDAARLEPSGLRADGVADGIVGNSERECAERNAGAGIKAQGGVGVRAVGNGAGSSGATGAWDDTDWLPCTDGKARPVEPGTFPLAHGIPGRVGRLRAYGNAIVPQLAAEFIIAACK